jgi:hypothetical protein
MQAAEAMQLVMTHLDKVWVQSDYKLNVTDEEKERIDLAMAVLTAMLNTMLPVARYRCFVEVDPGQKIRENPKGTVYAEYTVCAVNVAGIKSGISGLGHMGLDVRVLLFEQRETGADIVSAFQGNTKSQKYRMWYKTLAGVEDIPTVQ